MEGETKHDIMLVPIPPGSTSTYRHDSDLLSSVHKPETKCLDTDLPDALPTLEAHQSVRMPSRDSLVLAPTITREMRLRARLQFAACCCCLYVAGWNDGTTGPLLPRIQEVYHVCDRVFMPA